MNKYLSKPLDSWYITQNFGDNLACIDLATRKKTIYCDGLNPPEGYRSIYSQMKGHNGIDFYAPTGVPVYAALEGVVEEMVDEEARGKGLGIVSENKYYCDELEKDTNMKVRYWHLLSFKVNKGDVVKAGQLVGLADNTGYSSGSHLHFEMKPVSYKMKNGKITSLKNLLQTNGYYGAINPLPYFKPRVEPFLYDIAPYSRSGEVVRLQQILKELGFFTYKTCTGYYGEETIKAVKAFQKKYANEILVKLGLKQPTGYFGKSTRAKLNEIINS